MKGEYLKKCLEEAGLSHADLADKLGTGASAVSNWASGRADMPLAQIRKVIELGFAWNPARLSETGKEWYNVFVDYDRLLDKLGMKHDDDE